MQRIRREAEPKSENDRSKDSKKGRNINTQEATEKSRKIRTEYKSLWDRETEEKDRQNKRNNIIVFGLSESKAPDSEQRKSEEIPKMIGLCKNICHMNISDRDINRTVRLGKVVEDKDRPLLIMLKEEDKKRELFQNLNKIRDARTPFIKVIVTHDLTKKQKEELKYMVKQAREKEEMMSQGKTCIKSGDHHGGGISRY